jgi:hypothetical protein
MRRRKGKNYLTCQRKGLPLPLEVRCDELFENYNESNDNPLQSAINFWNKLDRVPHCMEGRIFRIQDQSGTQHYFAPTIILPKQTAPSEGNFKIRLDDEEDATEL